MNHVSAQLKVIHIQDGVRNGMGTLNFLDGGRLGFGATILFVVTNLVRVYGSWVNGELHGQVIHTITRADDEIVLQAEYWYPDGKSGLKGVVHWAESVDAKSRC